MSKQLETLCHVQSVFGYPGMVIKKQIFYLKFSSHQYSPSQKAMFTPCWEPLMFSSSETPLSGEYGTCVRSYRDYHQLRFPLLLTIPWPGFKKGPGVLGAIVLVNLAPYWPTDGNYPMRDEID